MVKAIFHARAAGLAGFTMLCAMMFGTCSAAGAPAIVDVFPIPGGRVAMPQTQLTFRGVPASALGGVSVVGSSSGVHPGSVRGDSDGRGASFIPTQPFSAGETVTVATPFNIDGSGTGTYHFTVAHPAGGFPDGHWPPARRVPNDVQHFRSRPDLLPVSVHVNRRGAYNSGDIFLGPQFGPLQDGPMILDPNGQIIWFDRMLGNNVATDFRVQTYQGQPVLTWWQGHVVAGVGIGQGIIFNRAYRRIATVSGGNGLDADLHEFELTPQGTALITGNYPVLWNASAVKGATKQTIVTDSAVQEIDIQTGLVLFQWDSLDHLPITDSYASPPKSLRSPYDAFHLNSIDIDRDGNLVISARNTWAAYKINRHTGALIWTLGGRHGSFKLAPGTYWAFQHDVRIRANNDSYVTLFDDSAGPPRIHPQSRAIKLFLDLKHMTGHQVFAHTHSPSLSSNFEGNYQQLSDHEDFVGWGQQPFFTQYDTHGRLAFDAQMAGANSSYRVYRFHWSAVPWTLPAVATASHGHSTTVYASWNGATAVSSWRVLGGNSSSSLHPVGSGRRNGFETAITVPAQRFVQAQALAGNGKLIKSSNVVTVH